MIISNKNYSADSEKENIHVRELELTIQDSDHVRLHLERSRFNFFSTCIWLNESQNNYSAFSLGRMTLIISVSPLWLKSK